MTNFNFTRQPLFNMFVKWHVVRHCMKTLYIISTLILLTSLSYGQKAVTIFGKVTEQNGKHLQGVTIRILLGGGYDKTTSTENSGSFTFVKIKKDNSYVISCAKSGYLSKTEIYRQNITKSKDTVFISIQLRQRNVAIINTSQISDKDLGLTIEKAIKKFKIDTTECMLQNEPPGISRGIEAELGDSTIIYLQIPRKANFNNHFSNILNEKITGIGLAFPDCSKKQFGTNFVWWGIRNAYCDQNE